MKNALDEKALAAAAGKLRSLTGTDTNTVERAEAVITAYLAALPSGPVTEEVVEAAWRAAPQALHDCSEFDGTSLRKILRAAFTAIARQPGAGEPVAWRYRGEFAGKKLPWQTTTEKWLADRPAQAGDEVEPLYASRIRSALTSPARPSGHISIAHDGFSGDIIGHYLTREGKPGVVVQQDGTRVVHVYGEKWLLVATSPKAEESGE